MSSKRLLTGNTQTPEEITPIGKKKHSVFSKEAKLIPTAQAIQESQPSGHPFLKSA